jgi:hypothetical protein
MPRSEKYAYIPVKLRTYRELQELKQSLGLSTWEELIKHLLEVYRQFRNFRIKQRLAEILCNRYESSSGSWVAWARIVTKHFTTAEELATAINILPEMLEKSRENPEEYTVKKDLCKEIGKQ